MKKGEEEKRLLVGSKQVDGIKRTDVTVFTIVFDWLVEFRRPLAGSISKIGNGKKI